MYPVKARSASSPRIARRVSPTPPACRSATGSVSGSLAHTTTPSTTPTTTRTTNTPRQSVKRRICPPMSGATTGATPEISMRVEKKRAMATPSYRSRTTARAMTIPAAPASPWTSRKATRTSTVGAIAHSAVATT